MKDPIVEEVRATRHRIFQECGGDLEQLIARLKKAESLYKDRLVTPEDVEKRRAKR